MLVCVNVCDKVYIFFYLQLFEGYQELSHFIKRDKVESGERLP